MKINNMKLSFTEWTKFIVQYRLIKEMSYPKTTEKEIVNLALKFIKY
jgi:hypothetical protein